LIQETRRPLAAQPGQAQYREDKYERNGTRNLFLVVEPQTGWRHMHLTEHRTALDFAYEIQWLVDEGYPEAAVIGVVLDNRDTHKPASLNEAFGLSRHGGSPGNYSFITHENRGVG
jgi:DDE superfamily endonuclease